MQARYSEYPPSPPPSPQTKIKGGVVTLREQCIVTGTCMSTAGLYLTKLRTFRAAEHAKFYYYGEHKDFPQKKAPLSIISLALSREDGSEMNALGFFCL